MEEKTVKGKTKASFSEFMQQSINGLVRLGKYGTASTYKTALASLMRFNGDSDLPMHTVRSDLILRYETWLRDHGVSKNSSSAYMRSLRSVYNRAVESGYIVQTVPFRHVYTGVDKTMKRAVPLATIRTLRTLDLSQRPELAFARDLFLFSFYTRGMAFVDMAFLRKSDIRGGYLYYVRRKTQQQLCIRWEECMQTTVDRLLEYDCRNIRAGGTNEFLLPIIKSDKDPWKQYKSCQRLVNHHLKTISAMLGGTDGTPLTMYVARHSWASIAHSENIPLSVISEALGHDNEHTTQIYLASLENSRIDDANKKIIQTVLI